jgi:magnesium-transporting ATPase (P-type)
MRKEVEAGRRGKRRRQCASSTFFLSLLVSLLSPFLCAFVYFFSLAAVVFPPFYLLRAFFLSLHRLRFFVLLLSRSRSSTRTTADEASFAKNNGCFHSRQLTRWMISRISICLAAMSVNCRWHIGTNWAVDVRC